MTNQISWHCLQHLWFLHSTPTHTYSNARIHSMPPTSLTDAGARDAAAPYTKRKPPHSAQNEALTPKIVEDPAPTVLQELLAEPAPEYSPPLHIQDIPWRQPLPSLRPQRQRPIDLFFTPSPYELHHTIVHHTNIKAANAPIDPGCRPWHPITLQELRIYIGLLFCIGFHKGRILEQFWNPDGCHLGQYLSLTRFRQIRRFLCVNSHPRHKGDPWWWKLEPLASTIRENCRRHIIPSSWISDDESMVQFAGRSKDTTKMKHKPVSEGFKIWALASKGGHIHDWLFYSR